MQFISPSLRNRLAALITGQRTAPRMYFACTHVTLRATEVPVWLEAGLEVIPEEVDTAPLNVFEALQYDDPARHEVLRQCAAASTLPERAYGALRRCRLRQRRGALSAEEQRFFNRHVDIIYVATDLELAVAIKQWFSGEVIFRYFGTFENLRNLAEMVAEHRPEDLAGIVCMPIFDSLYELGIARHFERSVTVHGFVGDAALSPRWLGIREDQPAVVVMNHVLSGTAQARMLGRMENLARRIPIAVLGKNDLDRVPPAIGAAFDFKGILERRAFLEQFAAARMLIHPHAERYHNHYSNLEAVAMGIPVLFRTANPLYLEQPESLRQERPAEWFGAFETEEALFAAAERFYRDPEPLAALAERQRVLLGPYSRASVMAEIRTAAALFAGARRPRRRVEETDWLHARLACGETLQMLEDLAARGGTIPFAAAARETDWQLLAEDAAGEPAIRLRREDMARQLLFGDGYALGPGHYRLEIAGDMAADAVAEITIEIFTRAGRVAVRRTRIGAQARPALLAGELQCGENWLLNITAQVLSGERLDLATLTLTRLSGDAAAPDIRLPHEGPARLLAGEPVALAMLPLVQGDHRIAWDAAGGHPVLVRTADDGSLLVLLGDEQAQAPGRYTLEIGAEAPPDGALMAAIELFHGEAIVAAHKALALPGNDGRIVLQVTIDAAHAWAAAIDLRVSGEAAVRLGRISLAPAGAPPKVSALACGQTGAAAFLAGRNVPIEALTSGSLAEEIAAPAQLQLPAPDKRWAGAPLRVIATFTSPGPARLRLSAELWRRRAVVHTAGGTVALTPGRTVTHLDIAKDVAAAGLTPVLFVWPEQGAAAPRLTHLRLAHAHRPGPSADALPSPGTPHHMDGDMQFYGQFDPPVDRFIFERYFPDTDIKGVFVECGAFDGITESSCKFFEESMGWTGYNLEPVPGLFALLEANRPLGRNLRAALSDRTGEATFTHAVHPVHGEVFGNGSLGHAEAHRQELESAECRFESYTVATLAWRDFVRKHAITTVDLLVLDVEGHELSVLEGMKGADVLPAVMCVEFGHLGLDGVRNAVRGLGYEYDIQSHGNAFFVRRDLLGLFALRRAAAGRSRGSGGERGGAAVMSVARLVPADAITARVHGDAAHAGLVIPTGEMATVRVPADAIPGEGAIAGFELHLAAASPGNLTIVVENWDSTGVIGRAERTTTVFGGRDVVTVTIPPLAAGTEFTAVIFLQVSPGCDALLTHVGMRSQAAPA